MQTPPMVCKPPRCKPSPPKLRTPKPASKDTSILQAISETRGGLVLVNGPVEEEGNAGRRVLHHGVALGCRC